MYMGFEFLKKRIYILLFYKPMWVFCDGFARKGNYSVRMSTALRVKQLMRSNRRMRTRYGFCAHSD